MSSAIFIGGIKEFKDRIVPVTFEGDLKFFNDVKGFLFGHLDIPFQSSGQSRIGQVGGTYVGSRKIGVPVKKV